MKKILLTEPQIQFLTELNNGLTISVCIELCNQFGKLIGKEKFSGKIQLNSLFKLCELGLIESLEACYYGLRHYDCKLSDKGRDVLGVNHA